jgi:hypothetical protein
MKLRSTDSSGKHRWQSALAKALNDDLLLVNADLDKLKVS